MPAERLEHGHAFGVVGGGVAAPVLSEAIEPSPDCGVVEHRAESDGWFGVGCGHRASVWAWSFDTEQHREDTSAEEVRLPRFTCIKATADNNGMATVPYYSLKKLVTCMLAIQLVTLFVVSVAGMVLMQGLFLFLSTNFQAIRWARILPTVVFPEPMKPTRNSVPGGVGCGCEGMSVIGKTLRGSNQFGE